MNRAGITAILLFILSANFPAFAQQEIKDKSGNSFMTEDLPPAPAGQQIKTEGGGLFMEEVPQKQKPKKAAPKPQIDIGSLGVPVDPKGRIVPLIQPSPGGVLPNYSKLEMGYTPPTVYVPYSTYNGFYPGRPGMPVLPYPGPNGYPGYPAYNPGFYPGYNPGFFPGYNPAFDPGPGFNTGFFSGYNPQRRYPYYNYTNPFPYGYYPSVATPYTPGYTMNPPGYNGVFTAPLGVPRYFTSSTDDAPDQQQANYQFSGSYWNGWPSASVWSPGWRSPFSGSLFVPSITQFQNQGSVKAIFPESLDTTDSNP